jgi:hypothetical protein
MSIGEHVEHHVTSVIDDPIVAVYRTVTECVIGCVANSSCSVGLL